MADHNLDRQPGLDRLADDIKKVQQQISELRTLQLQGNNALNPQVTGGYSLSWTPLLNNGQAYGYFRLQNAENKRLFGFPNVTFYEGTIAVGNEIGHGNVRDLGYEWSVWTDWGDTDDNNIICRVVITNKSGASKDVHAICGWRYVVGGGAGGGGI